MNIEIKINNCLNIRYQILNGTLNVEEIVLYLDRLVQEQKQEFDMNVCWDLSGADLSDVHIPELKKLVRKITEEWRSKNSKKMAIVVSDKLKFGLARIYQSLLDFEEISSVQIFYTSSDALDWLTAS